MSNYLAVATVSAALRQTLQEAVSQEDLGATVTLKRPDADASSPTINVYLYQVTPNAAWRNADLPTRRDNGRLVQRPRVALDLHYLLTFHGKESELQPERLLGCAVRRLHERPVLARSQIRTVVDDKAFYLADSDLAEESEMVKFAPSALSLEELSKLWSIFFQTRYVLSMAYKATLVLIDGTETPQPSPPVKKRHIEVTVP